MIDYILSFPDEATAFAALSDWRHEDQWIAKLKCGVFPDRKVILQPAIWDNSEPPVQTQEEVTSEGYWMVISMPETDDAFYNQSFVLSEHDRTKAVAGNHILRTKFTQEQIDGVHSISPGIAGANYPF